MQIKRALAGVLAVVMTMTLVACGGGGAAGDWQIDKAELKKQMEKMMDDMFAKMGEQGMPADQIKEAKSQAMKGVDEQLEKTDAVITLKSDGTMSVTGKLFGEAKKNLGGKWTQDGETITFIDGEGDNKKEIKGSLKDGKLRVKIDQPGVPEDFELVLKPQVIETNR